MKWAKSRVSTDPRYNKFIEFGHKFLACVRGQREEKWWSTGHLIKDLLLLEQSQAELWRRYGRSLAHLKHMDAAENAHQMALQLSPNHYWTVYAYARFLMTTCRFAEAEQMWYRAMKVSKFKNKDRNLLVGLATCMERLQQPHKAEYYYKLSVGKHDKDDPKRNRMQNDKHKTFYEPAHFFYGSFLQKQGRFKEAREQFEICTERKSTSINHYRLGNVLLALKDFDGFEYHLNKALEIDPYMPMARKLWKRYYENGGHGNVEEKQFIG